MLCLPFKTYTNNKWLMKLLPWVINNWFSFCPAPTKYNFKHLICYIFQFANDYKN